MRARVAESIVQALERGATIVTANERAAREARRGWDELQREQGQSSWETARALSWRSWLATCWHALQLQGVSDRMLLNEAQEHRVWRSVLVTDDDARTVRDLDALARTCAEAYARLCEYDGLARLAGVRGSLRGDPAAFARWTQLFEQQCRRERLLPPAALPAEIARRITPETMPATDREVVFTGFDELTPAMEKLLFTWRDQGGTTAVVTQPALVQGGTVVSASDGRAELRGFARWARERLKHEPGLRIGLVVADLAGERDEIESVLREVLSPELEDIQCEAVVPFEFSLGRSLAAEPLVRAATEMLRWQHAPSSLDSIERLLLGPGLGGYDEERAARGELTRRLRRESRLLPRATIDQVLRLMDDNAELGRRLPLLGRALRGLRRFASTFEVETRQSFGSWADHVRGVLGAALWAQGVSSRGYQVVDRWEGVLDTLASLDFRGETVEWSEMAANLDQLVQETIFAPERRETPVQVLGPNEAAGSAFDALWVLRAGELQWPPERAATPLLPRALARTLGIPGFDRHVDRRRSVVMTERLHGSATEVLFSYTERTQQGGQQRPAGEVVALGLRSATISEVTPLEPEQTRVMLEEFEDAGQIAPLRDLAVRGGVRVLELQAQCGFRAFAELRLHAEELDRANFGLSSGERGSAVHRALEALWGRLQSQEALLALPEAERWAVLDAAIEAGLSQAARAAEGTWARSYLDVQRERMQRLLRKWLETEMKRPPFVVSQQEAKVQALHVGPLELSIRVDRVDLVNGSRVLLDYKTGAATTADWRGERPDLPQVPLYAVLASTPQKPAHGVDDGDAAPLGAVAFAKVVKGKDMGLQGYEAEGADLLPVKSVAKMESPSFAEQVERWSEIVTRLATEFATGDARVRPKQFPKACTYCGQRLLCRVDPADFYDMAAEEDDEDEVGHDG